MRPIDLLFVPNLALPHYSSSLLFPVYVFFFNEKLLFSRCHDFCYSLFSCYVCLLFLFLLTVTFSFPNFRLFISVCYLKILACNDVALCNLCDFPEVVVFILVVVVDVVVDVFCCSRRHQGRNLLSRMFILKMDIWLDDKFAIIWINLSNQSTQSSGII